MEIKEESTEAAVAAVAETKATEVVAEAMVEEAGETTVPREEVAAKSVGVMSTTRILPMFPSTTKPPNNIISSPTLRRHN